MLPVSFDPNVPGLVPAFATVMRAEFAWILGAALLGMVAIAGLLLLDVVRSRRRLGRLGRRDTPTYVAFRIDPRRSGSVA